MAFDTIIHGAKIILPNDDAALPWHALPFENMAIAIENGIIAAIGTCDNILQNGAHEIVTLDGGILTAGFIDTQVNGGGGVLFNDDPTPQTILQIKEAHRKFGTTSLLPTLISDDLSKVEKAISAIKTLIESDEDGILGIHLEGPLLNPEKKGIHEADKFKILDNSVVKTMSTLEIAPTLITLAPEMHKEEFVLDLENRPWVILAAGHTNANAKDMMHFVENGGRGITHLFNAMRQMTAREPGVVGYALASRSLYCGIIVDMVHVDGQNIRLAYDVLGSKNLMLVTDAMNPVGTDEKEFLLYGQKICVRDGSCFDENGTLAGSALDMATAVRNAHFKVGIPMGHSFEMASGTPARFLHKGDEIGSIRIGLRADLVHLDDNLYVKQVF